VRGRATSSAGEELTASSLAERFGFGGERMWTLTEDLSGGERRRLQLMRLLMSEPNVLLLDEPTNDLDIDTLTALEDLLDGWPGTLVVVSHDRYFLERVCDDIYALPGDGGLRHLPGGVQQYLQLSAGDSPQAVSTGPGAGARGGRPAGPGGPLRPGAQRQAARRELTRIERRLESTERRVVELQSAMTSAATDAVRLNQLSGQQTTLSAEREELESRWLELSEELDDSQPG
jgi:ATP-binding cassette subfamily F protein uup